MVRVGKGYIRDRAKKGAPVFCESDAALSASRKKVGTGFLRKRSGTIRIAQKSGPRFFAKAMRH